ncbi:MAG: chorismate synthase, partial [Bacillota bacterium]
SVKDITDTPFDVCDVNKDLLKEVVQKDLPIIDDKAAKEMKKVIIQAKEKGDSVGGVVECAILGIEAGLGNPMFEGVENIIASIMFAIPAVKGVEFGKGFEITKLYGSQANDEMYMEGDKVKTYSNNSGGINGGITNGMPVVFSVAIKPTPSIAKKQRTINLKTKKNSEITVQGRHDPCIVIRALPVVEAAANIAILDMIMGDRK